MVVWYRRFETINLSSFKSQSAQENPLKWEGCPETSVLDYHSTLRPKTAQI